jgi:hypothetical protein
MPDNRIISKSKYVVNSVTSPTTDNRLTKKPYTDTPDSHSKRQNASDSFTKTLKSASPHESLDNDSTTFSNELENMARLKSEEDSRLVLSNFRQTTLNHSNSSEDIIETELHNKLSQAMKTKIDSSILSKKIELLNALKNESNN